MTTDNELRDEFQDYRGLNNAPVGVHADGRLCKSLGGGQFAVYPPGFGPAKLSRDEAAAMVADGSIEVTTDIAGFSYREAFRDEQSRNITNYHGRD